MPHVIFLQGNTSAVMQTLANLTTVKALDLTSNVGIKGSIDSGAAADGICKSAKVQSGG